ncbi:Nramp family divalent metal transporter [Propionibacteriaceae bacterium G57]|uniref:Nramp family divalent metal transporter n=1 Tax=Aestuariimicrobium sp. G57 TaxID=3418485 RepID=UPI003DA70457
MGPAFVAAVAYVDPGNFAANFSAGADHGYALLWVLVLVNLMACCVQYLAAKVGFVTGRSLSELVADHLPGRRLRGLRLAYWAQATGVVIATDIAEVIGGAVGLYLLFGVPLVAGGVITGLGSLALLAVHSRWGQKSFERVILGLLLLIPMGFFAGLVARPPAGGEVVAGLVPRLTSSEQLYLAVAMMGATVMPHVIYLHTTLSRDRHGRALDVDVPRLVRATRVDVGLAMALAGSINISMLVLSATAMRHHPRAGDFVGIHDGLAASIGGWVATLFAAGLLISGLASTAVGGQAGSSVMDGLVSRDLSVAWRRLIVIVPAVVLLALVPDVTGLLVLSQAVLSFGIPFALLPLVWFGSRRQVMGRWVISRWFAVLMWGLGVLIVVVCLALVAASAVG